MLLSDFNEHPEVDKQKHVYENQVQSGEISVSEAAEKLIALYRLSEIDWLSIIPPRWQKA